MSFLDRFSQERTDILPAQVMPGRYAVLSPLTFNHRIRLPEGELLVGDGSQAIRFRSGVHHLLSGVSDSDGEVEANLVIEAVSVIAREQRNRSEGTVSPMLPPDLLRQAKLLTVERLLQTTLEQGHLHAISERPRTDLRYENQVVSVDRARRLASSALPHLASHSDCWQRRTVSGILPRKILARLSEDDYGIYENRLFKRLLEWLEYHLARRLISLRSIRARLDGALEFERSEHVHHRLCRSICELWGEAYHDVDVTESLRKAQNAESVIIHLLKLVRSLKSRGLYRQIRRNLSVPSRIHLTNILQNDAHYRHLPPLWDGLAALSGERDLSAQDWHELEKRRHRDYSEYVGVVIRRSLDRYHPAENDGQLSFKWGGFGFELRQEGHDWLITREDGKALRCIPVLWFGRQLDISDPINPMHLLCWPGQAESRGSEQGVPVSPMDLYVVERLGQRIDQWLIRSVLDGYGTRLGPLPGAVLEQAASLGVRFEVLKGPYGRLLAPLDPGETGRMVSVLQSANETVRAAFERAMSGVSELSRLCGCDHQASFQPVRGGGFSCQCRQCGSVWSLNVEGDQKRFTMKPKGSDDLDDPFDWCGRDWRDMVVASTVSQDV
ncbi:MAG: DUF2357 domain-containing protein [Lautropia sp.]|nr:DUF2357 domain-containing protein [Lautropia sp.]